MYAYYENGSQYPGYTNRASDEESSPPPPPPPDDNEEFEPLSLTEQASNTHRPRE
jgi:hypothetical protein